MGLDQEDQTAAIIGAAIEVHRTLGPGFLESVYELSLAAELTDRGIPFARQVAVPLWYKGRDVGTHPLDLLVGDIVVELKAVRELVPEHFATVQSYLRAVGRQNGLILNFSAMPLQIKRVRNV